MQELKTRSQIRRAELNIKTLTKAISKLELVDRYRKKEMYGVIGKIFGIMIVEDHGLPENFWYIRCSPDVYKAIQEEIKKKGK